MVYFGPPAKALTHFSVQRFAEIYRLVGRYSPPAESPEPKVATEPAHADVRELVQRFQRSRDYFQYIEARQTSRLETAPNEQLGSEGRRRRTVGVSASDWTRFRRQLGVLTARYWKLIRRDRLNFATLLLQGLLVAGLLWAVAAPDTFQPKGAENAQTVLFIMACAAAWLGILNATKEIVKERDIYARERRYGLSALPYVLSKLIVLAAVGVVQIGSLLLVLGFRLSPPHSGVLGAWSPTWFEWFISLELTLVAGLALGLFLSASTATIDAATAIMFVLLLIQVMFAGLFFPDARWADTLSVLTFSRWGLEAAGTTADLNSLLTRAIGNAYQIDIAYTFSALHLLGRWAILCGYAIVLTALASVCQARKK